MRYKITLSYDGSAFCGWQKQPDAPSVQETLENALGTLVRHPVDVVGAGRTDTGVSAVGYVAHFEVPDELDAVWLSCKINAILPPSVAVHSISPAGEEFHARFGASKREYTYFLHRNKDPFATGWSYCFMYPELNFELMNKAAALLVGTHDFSCFQKTGSDNKTTTCTVFGASWSRYSPTHADLLGYPGEYWYFRIDADRFLRGMVRAVVGTLLEVGRGKRSLDSFESLLSGGSRCKAGESAPGHALFLSRIDYPEE